MPFTIILQVSRVLDSIVTELKNIPIKSPLLNLMIEIPLEQQGFDHLRAEFDRLDDALAGTQFEDLKTLVLRFTFPETVYNSTGLSLYRSYLERKVPLRFPRLQLAGKVQVCVVIGSNSRWKWVKQVLKDDFNAW